MKELMGKFIIFTTLVIVFIFASTETIISQIVCDISIDTQIPVCPETYFELGIIGFVEPSYTFNWQKKTNGNFITVGTDSILGTSTADTATYKVVVIDTIAHDTCESAEFAVGVYPQINVNFDQIQLTCTNGDTAIGNSAMVRATATGELLPDEYHYYWDVPPLHIAPGDSSLAIGLKGHQYYSIVVRDNHNCPKNDTMWTKTFINPEVEITADPDTAYIQKPFITYSYVNLSVDSVSISNHFWWFQDSVPDPNNNTSDLLTPTYTYKKVGSYDVVLTVYNDQGCDTTFTKTVQVKPVKLFIPNVFTPGDGSGNETFMIINDPKVEQGKEYKDVLSKFYQSSHLVVFNRMGRTVFEADNYDGMWNGDNLEDGVYYYVLECHGTVSTDIFKGPITIIRPK